MANIQYSIANTVSPGALSSRDLSKVTSLQLIAQFDPARDFAEASVYDISNNFLYTVPVNVGINSPSTPKDPNQVNEERDKTSTNIYINPEAIISGVDVTNLTGVTAVCSFFRNILAGIDVEEISYDRTEIKLKLTSLVKPVFQISQLVDLISNNAYYGKVGIAHTQGQYTAIINISVQEDFIYLKLYNALPNLVNLGDPITIIQEIADPVSIAYVYEADAPIAPTVPYLRSANFNIDLEDRSTVTTEYLNYNDLYNLPVTNSFNRIFSELEGNGININVDYTDYSNFIHFSSAKERLANFKYKVDLIHQYEQEKTSISTLSSASNAITSSNTYYDNLVKNIVSKFDGYERYLYYESSSKAWPKSNSTRPYINLSSSLAPATAWFTAEYTSASLYDELNESGLEYTTPEFIRQNDSNAPYSLFLNMIGQHFDELWLYSKAVTDKYNADNRLDYGISKELITKTLQNFGVKLYSSNFAATNLANLYLGEWYNTGSEYITSFVTASNEPTPDKDILAETYKRIYHNLPYLLKTKGTERGLRALINCFGVPSSSLSINTFGGITRNVSPYLAYDIPATDKVRLDYTGSIIPGNTLSQYTNIIKPDEKYNQDLNLIEIGFSPTDYIDDYILTRVPGNYMNPPDYTVPWWALEAYVENGDLDVDHFIGDPRFAGSKNYQDVNGVSMKRVAESLLSGSDTYNVVDFIRLTKFFDNQLFKMIKDFVPARDTVSAGIIIKPHILNRSKATSPIATFTQPEYSASINTAFISGSAAGVLDQYSTAYTASVLTPSGSIQYIYNDEAAQINGELGGTILDMYSRSLNEANTLKKPSTVLPYYDSTGSVNISPEPGAFHWQYGLSSTGLGAINGYQVKYLYINEEDLSGNNIEPALSNLKPGDTITFTVNWSTVAPVE